MASLKKTQKDKIIKPLKAFFQDRDEVLMAFLFGSRARGTSCRESDVDIAVYFTPREKRIEIEELASKFKVEDEIWSELEKILKKDVDLVVLNRASVTVADLALKGIPILIKDRKTYLHFMLRVSRQASDLRELIKDYWRLKESMHS